MEATAIGNGVKAAVQADYKEIHIEGSNKILIQAVKGKIQVPWEIQVIIQDIHLYIQTYNKVIISHVFR